MRTWLRLNALALTMFAAFVVFLVLQSVFGWQTRNEELVEAGRAAQGYLAYLGTGHFAEATFENWESEFLQMGSYVLLTAFLVQKGSPESHPITDKEEGPAGPPDNPESPGAVQPDSPWPVRRGGIALAIYQHSLTIALLGFFALSFVMHLLGGTANHNEELSLRGEPPISAGEFLASSEFWFQSMQNWQSEFMAVGSLIVLSIFLRQRGSSQSKHVAEPHSKTG